MSTDDSHRPARLFISYSRDDAGFLTHLLGHLSELIQERLVEVWHDRLIEPGEEWAAELHRELDRADLFVMLASPSFNSSAYIQDVELARAIELHEQGQLLVIPIVVRPIAEPLEELAYGHLQALPVARRLRAISEWEDPDLAWRLILGSIRAVVGHRQSPTAANLAAWELSTSLAMLFVDTMRLAVVIYGSRTRVVNQHRLDEFFAIADNQSGVVELHLAGHYLGSSERSAAAGIQSNLAKVLLALRYRPRAHPGQSILDNLSTVAHRLDRLLQLVGPKEYAQVKHEVAPGLVKLHLGPLSSIDSVAASRFSAQQTFLDASSPLRSVAQDFDQVLAVPYFLIDAVLLESRATDPGHID